MQNTGAINRRFSRKETFSKIYERIRPNFRFKKEKSRVSFLSIFLHYILPIGSVRNMRTEIVLCLLYHFKPFFRQIALMSAKANYDFLVKLISEPCHDVNGYFFYRAWMLLKFHMKFIIMIAYTITSLIQLIETKTEYHKSLFFLS
jgi:hypothetical protein